ncbi:ST1C2 Sulfotransferase, partial [Polypterus senegalus]
MYFHPRLYHARFTNSAPPKQSSSIHHNGGALTIIFSSQRGATTICSDEAQVLNNQRLELRWTEEFPEEMRGVQGRRCTTMSNSLGALHHEACSSGPSNPTTTSERQRLCDVKGVPLISSIHEIFGRVEKFQAKADDILIATYPKAVFCKSADTKIKIVKLNFGGLILSRCDKVIYVARNAKDVLVSYFFFHKIAPSLPHAGSWDDFFESFLSGNVAWGSWFDHVTGWWDVREKHQILYVFYEDILQDPTREVERVARFLGHILDKGTIQEIVKHTSFNMMKDNPMTNASTMPTCIVDVSISPFMRKGQVGDWKNHFTVAQDERFEEEYRRRMAGTSLRFRTEL